MQFNNFLFRASSIGYLMVDPKSKADKEAGNLSESAKTHLVDCYISAKYNRREDIDSKYITKGLMVEEDGITLYSRVKKLYFKKNETHLKNDFVMGTPDLFTGLEITSADRIIDIKCSWSIYSFMRVLSKDVNSLYYWQMQTYLALTGAKSATLAYCLIDTPETLINDEKRRLMYRMGAATDETPAFVEACEELDRAMRFGDIPMKEKVIEFEIPRNEDDINAIYAKVIKGRQFLNEFEASRFSDVLLAEQDQQTGAILVEAAK